MKLTKIRDLSIEIEIRSVCFLDDDSVAAITPAGDVWRMTLASDRPARLFSRDQVLNPITQALDQKSIEPAKGGYPRLFASRKADWLIVNTHDFVLVACHLEIDQSIRLVATGWGQYYPSLTFSANGRWLCARSDETVVYDLHSWKWQILKNSSCAGWYTSQSALLILDNEGHLSRMDIERGTPPEILGSLPPSSDLFANPVVDMCTSLSGQHVVLAYEKGDLEWWQLSPFQNIARVPVGDKEIIGMTASLEKQCVASETETGIRFYHLEKPISLMDPLQGYANPYFSPSGKRFMAIEKKSSNPKRQAGMPPLITLWEVE
jgi:hypothetical protein